MLDMINLTNTYVLNQNIIRYTTGTPSTKEELVEIARVINRSG